MVRETLANAFFAYANNYLIDTDNAVIVDLEATRAIRHAEGGNTRTMIERTRDRLGLRNTPTFVAALRCDRIDAPWVFDAPVKGDVFRTYVEKVLVPTLRPGDVVVMDNLGSHKAAAVRRAIRKAGAHLPLYSRDLNPIERAFARLRHRMRDARPRSRRTPSGVPLAPSSTASRQTNAQTTPQTPDKLPSKPDEI